MHKLHKYKGNRTQLAFVYIDTEIIKCAEDRLVSLNAPFNFVYFRLKISTSFSKQTELLIGIFLFQSTACLFQMPKNGFFVFIEISKNMHNFSIGVELVACLWHACLCTSFLRRLKCSFRRVL